jgi:uncharacterized lipoprotein YajG
MKKKLISLATLLLLVGCSTSQQTTTFNALSSIESVADVGYSNYVTLVIQGKVSTNSLPQVSQAYNTLHAAIATAALLDQSGTNILVSSNLTTELTSFVQLISTATQGK